MSNDANERMERYLYQVGRLLPSRNRADIEREIRSLIGDMLEERCRESEPTQQDVDRVLLELGDPRELAAKYTDTNRYLIGPAMFSRYVMVLKIVGACVGFGITIACIVSAIEGSHAADGILFPSFGWFANWLATLMMGFAGGFAWVTAIFAGVEHGERLRLGGVLKKGLEGFEQGALEVELGFRGKTVQDGGTFLDTLPPVPQEKAKIPHVEPIVGIAATVVFLVALIFVPSMFSVWISQGGSTQVIPIFDIEALRKASFLIVICCGLSIVRDVFRLIEGRYTKRLAAVTVLCDLPAIFIWVFFITRYSIFNRDLFFDIGQVAPGLAADLEPVLPILSTMLSAFVFVVIFAFVLDMGTTIYKALRYQ